MLEKNLHKKAPQVTAVSEIDDRGAHSKNQPPAAAKKPTAKKPKAPKNGPWYVVYCVSNHEKKAADYLARSHYETFLPTQKERRERKDGSKVTIDALVIPMLLFIRPCQEVARIDLVKLDRLSFIVTLLTVPGSNNLATVPDSQLQNFRLFLKKSTKKVTLETGDVKTGDRVRIRFGKFKGLVGDIERTNDKSPKVIIRLDYIGFARVEVNLDDIEYLTDDK